MPLTSSIKSKVTKIVEREAQPGGLVFLDRRREPFAWTDEVPMDDPQFQGLLEPDAPYPDIPDDYPGMVQEEEGDGPQPAVQEEPDPNAEQLTNRALKKAGLERGPGEPREDDPEPFVAAAPR